METANTDRIEEEKMSATARLVKPEIGVPAGKAPEARSETADRPEASPVCEAPEAPASKGKKGVLYRGICIYCGAKIEIAVDRREIACFAYCNAECKARFDAEMNEALD